MRSSRWDANGNIYLVTEESLSPDAVRAEVGDTDGILEVFRSGDDWVEIAIWNPDGSRAEMSGNGTRIAACWLAERTGADEVTVRVGPREVKARMLGGALVEQDLGEVLVSEPEEVAGIKLTVVDVGNPHAVVEGDPADLPRVGPLLEVHERFPQRTNVQVARRTADSDRGARLGTRCGGDPADRRDRAAFAVAAALGISPAVVRFPGGELHVRLEGTRVLDRSRQAPSSAADPELAQRVVERRLQIGRLVAPADDQRAREVVRAGGELLRPRARHDDRARRHVAAVLDRLRRR